LDLSTVQLRAGDVAEDQRLFVLREDSAFVGRGDSRRERHQCDQ
jgi:hypothetical protein